MIKKKLPSKYTEVPTTVKILPSNSFCEKCKNTDTRAVKDTLIRMLNVLHLVSETHGIYVDTWEEMETKLKTWCREELRKKEVKEQKSLGKRYGGKG